MTVGGRGPGAAAITVPLHHPLTRQTYALGVFAPESRFASARSAEEWIELMKAYASDIQGALQGETASIEATGLAASVDVVQS